VSNKHKGKTRRPPDYCRAALTNTKGGSPELSWKSFSLMNVL